MGSLDKISALSCSPSPDYYTWEVEGKPIKIEINLKTIERMNRLVSEAASSVAESAIEVGGILLGHVDQSQTECSRVVIDNFEPITSEHLKGNCYVLSAKDKRYLSRKISSLECKDSRGLGVIGYYRSHIGKGLYLTADDFSLIRTYFSDPCSVFLLIKIAAGKVSTGGFFFWETEDIRRHSTLLEFPFNQAELEVAKHPGALPAASGEQAGNTAGSYECPLDSGSTSEWDVETAMTELRVERGEIEKGYESPFSPADQQIEFGGVPDEREESKHPRHNGATVKWDLQTAQRELRYETNGTNERVQEPRRSGMRITASGASSLVTSQGGFLIICAVLIAILLFAYRMNFKRFIPAARAVFHPLALNVERNGRSLHLSWNRNDPTIQEAVRGVLWISDGGNQHKLNLETLQLNTGSLLYWPVSTGVNFRLEIFGPHNVTESIQTLMGSELSASPKSLAASTTKAVQQSPPSARAPLVPKSARRVRAKRGRKKTHN